MLAWRTPRNEVKAPQSEKAYPIPKVRFGECCNAFSSLGLGSPCKHGSYIALSVPRVRHQRVAAAFQIRLVDVQGVGVREPLVDACQVSLLKVTGGGFQGQGVDDVVVAGIGVVAFGGEQRLLGVEHVHHITGTYLVTGLGGFQG
jgi:hypothetical protein